MFENLYYLGFSDVGAWAIPTSDGIILFDALNTADEGRDVLVGRSEEGRTRSGANQIPDRRARPQRPHGRRRVPAEHLQTARLMGGRTGTAASRARGRIARP